MFEDTPAAVMHVSLTGGNRSVVVKYSCVVQRITFPDQACPHPWVPKRRGRSSLARRRLLGLEQHRNKQGYGGAGGHQFASSEGEPTCRVVPATHVAGTLCPTARTNLGTGWLTAGMVRAGRLTVVVRVRHRTGAGQEGPVITPLRNPLLCFRVGGDELSWRLSIILHRTIASQARQQVILMA